MTDLINRIVVVGFGSIGKRHLRLARKIFPSADIRVLKRTWSIEVPENSNGCFFNIDEAIAFQPQIAVIANPAPFHVTSAQALANAGVHLLVEKPFSDSLDGVSKLLETCEDLGLILQVGYNLRFLPSLQYFRDMLKSGHIGKVFSFRCEVGQYLPSWRPEGDYRRSVSASSKLGGGALLELSHEIDYLRWIFGEIEWVNATLSKQSRLEIDVEDTAHLVLGFEKVGRNNNLVGVLNLDFIRHDTTRSCIAIGETGSLHWDGLTGRVSVYMAGGREWSEIFRHESLQDESYLAEWHSFISCVLDKKEPIVTGEDGAKVLKIIYTARVSAEIGCPVALAKIPHTHKARS